MVKLCQWILPICLNFSAFVICLNTFCAPSNRTTGTGTSTMNRYLVALTCNNAKSDLPTMVWNATGFALQQQGIKMLNLCASLSWNQGLLIKPTRYLRYLKAMPETTREGALTHALLMDADVMWATQSVEEVWARYDCVRGNRDAVVSTEMNCWIGKHCASIEVDYYYPDVSTVPSYSAFVNSGLMMGTRAALIAILEHEILHAKSYRVRGKFRDQFAATDYVQRHADGTVAIDMHQHLFGSVRVFAPENKRLYSVPKHMLKPNFTCKAADHSVTSPCVDWTPYLFNKGYFTFAESSCAVQRRATAVTDAKLRLILESLSPTPIIWHESGRKLKYRLDQRTFVCAVARMTEDHPLRKYWERFAVDKNAKFRNEVGSARIHN